MKKGDLIILILAVVLALLPLALLLPQTPGSAAVIRQNGRILRRLPLTADNAFTVENGTGQNCIEIRNGEAFITSANCPDKTCMRMGSISRTGETLVCLPHRLTVTIEGAAETDAPDAVTR